MNKFIITATDRDTGKRLYGRLNPNSGRLTFRTGIAVGSTPERRLGLHTERAGATPFDIEVAGQTLVEVIAGLGLASWIVDPCIMLA